MSDYIDKAFDLGYAKGWEAGLREGAQIGRRLATEDLATSSHPDRSPVTAEDVKAEGGKEAYVGE